MYVDFLADNEHRSIPLFYMTRVISGKMYLDAD